MGLLDELRKYVKDALPGGLLNPEVSSQGILDGAALSTTAVPVLGDLLGLGADLHRYKNEPESRTLGNFALSGLGMLPFVPAMGGIVNPSVAKTLTTQKAMPDGELFSQAVANTKGASIGDDGLTMMLQRNQVPDQSMQPSVRGGVFYLPEGAAQAKHYSTGKNGYGGTEKITGETLIQNPLFAKGGTGGKAPESAFDSLMGKGAYQDMRTDALKSVVGYGSQASDKVAATRSFLEKYAPELADQAEYIVQNSKQGNQLAYALQEAAVGSAVRNAGHDAVLGYSKGKQGPFLSEIFDVRESHYPDKFGGSKIWPNLLGN